MQLVYPWGVMRSLISSNCGRGVRDRKARGLEVLGAEPPDDFVGAEAFDAEAFDAGIFGAETSLCRFSSRRRPG